MPIGSAFGAGEGSYANQTSTLKLVFNSTVDAQEVTDSVQSLGMTTVRFVLNQAIGALGATVVPQFCVSSGGGDVQWFDMDTPLVLPPGVTQRLEYLQPARAVRLAITRPAGQVTQTVVIITVSS